jgi:hypothetical protein
MSQVSGMIVIPASLRSDFIHIAGMPIHIPLESIIHIAGIRSYVYSGERLTAGDLLTPVFVEYNFFSLQADEVVYDVKSRTIKANGNVSIEDDSGKRRANSMTFRMENGQATPLPGANLR